MSLAAELGSSLSTLEQLADRLSSTADALLGTVEEDLGLGLIDVERNLRAASRRLERLVADARSR